MELLVTKWGAVVAYLWQYFGIFLYRQQQATTLADTFRDFIQFFVQKPRIVEKLT